MIGTAARAQRFDAVCSLMAEAERRGVKLWVDGTRLRYRAPPGSVPPEFLERLKSQRADIIGELSKPEFSKRERSEDILRLPEYSIVWWNETNTNHVTANGPHLVARIVGSLSLEDLTGILRMIISRHDVLGARVTLVDGVPCLVFSKCDPSALEVVDISGATPREPDRVVQQIIEGIVWRRFENGSIFRAFIVRVSANEHICGFVLHHFVADSVACQILADELVAALRDNRRAIAPRFPRPLQYADYVRGIEEWLSGYGPRRRLVFWKAYMADAPATFLPYDTDPGSALVGPLEYLPFEIPADCRARLARLASDLKVTLFLLVLAAHFITLSRLLRQHDLVLTVIISGREHPALADFVGNAADCLPIRMSVLPEMPLTEFIGQLQATYLLAYRHQVKWELLLEAFREIGANCTSPLTNLIAAEQTRATPPSGHQSEADIGIEEVLVRVPPSVGSVSWHVTHDINMCDYGQLIGGTVKYMTLRYSRTTIQHFLDCFVRCADAIGRDCGRAIRDISVDA